MNKSGMRKICKFFIDLRKMNITLVDGILGAQTNRSLFDSKVIVGSSGLERPLTEATLYFKD